MGIVSGGGAGAAGVSASTKIQTGNASPVGAVIPTGKGALYQDLTNGTLFVAIGATSADWVAVGGKATATTLGVNVSGTTPDVLYAIGGAGVGGGVLIQDTAASAGGGTGNTLQWTPGAADGQQSLDLYLGSTGQYAHSWAADGSYTTARGIKTGRQTSLALPTVALVSATAAQIDTVSDRETHTPVTFNPGVATTATCVVALSPDNVTFSTLAVVTKPVGTVFDGEIDDIAVRVPAGWYLKLTVTNATIGTTTYY